MKVIVGLGNPGCRYTPTRHNVGFLALDIIKSKIKPCLPASRNQKSKLSFKLEKKFESEIAKFKLGEEDFLLVKPQTFMNNSGRAVKKIIDFYKIDPQKDLIVIHDDIDIELGKIKIKNKGSSAGHKGAQSIIDALGTDRFLRVRVGVGRPSEGIEVEKYVLGRFSQEEKKTVEKMIKEFIDKIGGYVFR